MFTPLVFMSIVAEQHVKDLAEQASKHRLAAELRRGRRQRWPAQPEGRQHRCGARPQGCARPGRGAGPLRGARPQGPEGAGAQQLGPSGGRR